MPVIVQTVNSKVSAIWGRASIRDANGKFRRLALGDLVVRGDMILTTQDTIVQLTEDTGSEPLPATPTAVAEKVAVPNEVDRTIAKLEEGEIDFAPSAGTRAADGGLTPATVVERLLEVTPDALKAAPPPLVMPTFNPPVTPVNPVTVSLSPPVSARLTVARMGNAVETEATALAFPVELSGTTTQALTLPFQLSLDTAQAPDMGTPIFSNGVVLNADGTITVPAGVSSFVITVPTVDDQLIEGAEQLRLSLDGTNAVGTIRDNDQPRITTVEPGAPGISGDAVVEGNALVYTVSLSDAGLTASLFPFSLGGGSASNSDRGNPSFSHGVVLNSDGTISVPAGVSQFTITVPTVDDSDIEASEQLPLAVGGVSGVGGILDNDVRKPSVVDVQPGFPGLPDDTVAEGAPLVFSVTLSGPTSEPTNYPYALGGGSASPDDIATPSFSHGVILNPDGSLRVPAGVSAFTITLPTVQDSLVEGNETVPISLGGLQATGTIADDDRTPTIVRVEPGQPGVEDNKVTEGAPLTYGVTLSHPTTGPVTYLYSLGGGTASIDDFGTPTFSNGVQLNPDGTITVPAGVSEFTVTVPTTQDTAVEPDESVPLRIGGVAATGTIVDDDKPTIVSVEPGQPGISDDKLTEGLSLTFGVTLSQPTAVPATYPFTLGGGSAAGGDFGTPSFSNGVTLNPNGTITVPAGVRGFTVTVPTTQDTAVETDETLPLSIGGVTATGTIVDDDRPTITKVEPGQPGISDDKVNEGTALTYGVTLSQPTAVPTTYPFTLGGGSASAGDFGTPTFSNGVTLNPNGTITVPAGVSEFTVTVPTTQDTVAEPDESLPLSIDGVTATGTIVDDDKPTITKVEPGQPGIGDDKVNEGASLIYGVTLSQPTAVPTTYPFTLGGGSASAGDFGTPTFSNGVTLNPNGTITVPAGVSTFTVTVPTTQDTVAEPDESLPLSIGGVTATGTIVDDDKPIIVTVEPGQPGIGDDKVTEGASLTYGVTLSQPTAVPTTYPFALGGGSASAGDFGTPTFSNGVTLNPDGTITVPAGVSNFTVTVPTTQDSAVEVDEALPLSIGGVTATGTIVDDDKPTITKVEPGQPGATDDKVNEGGTLTYGVTLSEPTAGPTTYPFTLGGGTAGAGDFGTPVFSNGVTLNPDGTITVPAGVSEFTVTVPTTQDTVAEPDETLPLSVGGVTATGTIVDDDKPTITKVEPGQPGIGDDKVNEGVSLIYGVTLSQPTAAPTTYPFTLGGGSASAGDFGTPTFSNGVTLNPNGTITVPAGVSTFTVTVPTTQDTGVEPDETLPLSVGGVTATGTIVDDDKPTITKVEPGQPGIGDDKVNEGVSLIYGVTLSQPTAAPTTYPFTLGGGSTSAGDFGTPTFSNGVTLNPNGTITVPAGVSNFTVTVPTTQDTAAEPDETLPLSVGGVMATGTIVDDDKPTITKVEPGQPGISDDKVNEGAALVYGVTLSQPTATPVTYPFTLGGGTAGAGDFGTPVFSNGVTLNPDGTITVPAGVSNFTVTVPTTQDTAAEPDETLPLSVGGVTATGTIVDDDKPTITKVEPGQPGISDDKVNEGTALVYGVTLSQPTATPVTYPFTLGGGTAGAGDFGTPVFSNGVTLNPDGTITVPAGVSEFTVTVPTTQDTVAEPDETLPLSVGGVTATGTIVDDDKPTITKVEPGQPGIGDDKVNEGVSLIYGVTLSQPTATPVTYPFTLGGGSASAGDFGTPTFSNGVTHNPNGTITVPAGVSNFTVTVPTTQDMAVEAEESLPLSIGGVSAIGAIVDDDKPTITKVEPGQPGATDDKVAEGGTLTYGVTLSEPTAGPTTYPFTLGGGSAGAGDFGTPTFSNGVTLNPNGTITVPAGVSTFTVTVPTTQDTAVEPDETLPLSVGGVTATGTIVDDDKPTITKVEPGQPGTSDDKVNEGAALVYGVTLSQPTAAPTTYPFTLGGGSASAGDFGTPTFSNGVTLNPNGTITVPAGVGNFTVTVPTTQDTAIEAEESLPLSIGGVSATGTIVDDDKPNQAPVVQNALSSFSEEGLAGGLADNSGNPTDTTNAATATGRVVITDPEGQPLSSVVLTAPTQPLSSGGQPLVWTGTGTQTLTATAGGQTVITATIDNSGQYSLQLHKPLDHATAQGENLQRIDIGVIGSDGQASGSGTLTVQIEDDAPVATGITNVVAAPNVATNIMVVLDNSGSMNDPSGINGLTRLQAAVESIKTLLDRYDGQGDVAVRLVTFASEGKALGDVWTTVDQAKALLASVTASSGTNYDDALADAMTAFSSSGRIAGAQNVAYFLSDGAPTVASGSSSTLSGSNNTTSSDLGIQAAEAQVWRSFLDTQDIKSYALAVGSASPTTALTPIAHDGITGTPIAPVQVTSFADLNGALLSTTAVTTQGSLFTAAGSGLGADDGLVHSFSVDGKTYTFDPKAQSGVGGISTTATSGYSFDASNKTLTIDTAAGGRFVVDLDSGTYTYRTSTTAASGYTEGFNYTLIDADGDTASASGQVQVQGPPANQAPVVSAGSISVSEEGLAGGLADSTGSQGDQTNLSSASGRVSISDPDGQTITSVVLTAPTTALSSGGQAVSWAGSGTQSLTASAGGQVVATAHIDNQGNYSFKLLKPVDQASGNGENLKTLDIGISASDGKATGSGKLTVNIEDDEPQVGNASSTLQNVNTNVMVVLDISGSMGQSAPGLGMTRLQAAIKSIETLLDRYDANGDVAVRLVGFSSEGKALGDSWTSVNQAKSLLANLSASGATNYDDALADAMAAFGSAGKIAGAQNVSYFLSDGDPTAASGDYKQLSGSYTTNSSDIGIQSSEEKLWTDFLTQNHIQSHAMAMGGDVSDVSALNPIAFDGRSATNTAAMSVSSFADLGSALTQTSAATSSGKLFAAAGGGSGQMGADGGHVHSFSVGGITYTYNPGGNTGSGSISTSHGSSTGHSFDASTQTLSVGTSAGGQFFVDMDGGGYTYRAPAGAPAGFTEKFNFSLIDHDGDIAGGSGTVSMGQAVPGAASNLSLQGGSGSDHLQGGAGNDTLDGGTGSDHLFGGLGSDVFKWDLADRGTPGAPAIDTVHDFDLSPNAQGGDMLDLRDLLGGALQVGGADKLGQYLDIDTHSQPGSTVLHISTTGGFTDGQFKPGAEDQRIVLDGVNLHDALSLGAGATEDQLLNELINRNKIDTGL